jgi:bifunctional DNase/RNase
MVEVRLTAVRVDLHSNTPVLLLQETEGRKRSLPIFIGGPEANSIAQALNHVEPKRPMTHDLMRDILSEVGAKLKFVVVTEVRDQTYFAELHLVVGEKNRELEVSSRPSDAIALAIRTASPLFVSDELMDAEGVELDLDESDEEGDEDMAAVSEELVEQFKGFLDNLRPEDFSA